MLPSFLIQALFGFGGVCFLLCVYIFHYFREKVEHHTLAKTNYLFSSSTTDTLVKKIKKGEIPQAVVKDFSYSLVKIGEPRRRLRSLLLFFPVAGTLFMLSALFASIPEMQIELTVSFADTLEYLADSLLAFAIIVIIYCAYQLARLSRELT